MLKHAHFIVYCKKLFFNFYNGTAYVKWKLSVNTSKTKVMIFRKAGRLPANVEFHFGEHKLEIVSKFVYLGLVFTTGGSFSDAKTTLACQSIKAIFALNKYLHRFTNIYVRHKLELFDK